MDVPVQLKSMLTRENILIFAVLLIATVFSVAAQSFNFPFSNNAHHIPFVLDYANSAEGPSDIYHQSLSRFISAFWVLIGSVATEKNIYAVFLAAHIFFRFLILFMIWKIARLLSDNKALYTILPVLFVAFFPGLFNNSPVGKSEIFASYLTHSQAVIAVVLVGWFFLIKRQFLAAAILTAIAFDFNAFVGIWLGVVAGCTMIYTNWHRGIAYLTLHAVKMLAIFLVVASPVIIWLLHSVLSVPPVEDFDYRSYLADFYPYHNYFVYHLQETTAFLVFLGVGNLTLRWTGLEYNESKGKTVSVIFITYSAIFLVGMALPYVTGNRLILNLVPLRMDSYLIFLVTILILAWYTNVSSKENKQDAAFPIIALFCLVDGNVLLFIAALFLGRKFEEKTVVEKSFGWLLVGILMASHIYFGQATGLFSFSVNEQMMAFSLQAGVIAIFLMGHPRYLEVAILCISIASLRLLPEVNTLPAMGVLILTYGLIALSVAKRKKLPLYAPAILIFFLMVSYAGLTQILLLTGALMVPFIVQIGFPLAKKLLPSRLFDHSSMLIVVFLGLLMIAALSAFSRGGIAKNPKDVEAFREAQNWARENTAPHTLFLPIGNSGFSTFSRRPVWIEPTAGAMIMWAPENYDLWSERITKLREVSSVLDAVSLARDEKIPYIFINKSRTPMDPTLSHCVEFENHQYVILKTC